MTQAVTLEKLTIHCDTCGHEFPGELKEWHRKPCPECAAPDIVDDADMRQFLLIMGMADLINGMCGDVPEEHAATLRFDSSKPKGPNPMVSG